MKQIINSDSFNEFRQKRVNLVGNKHDVDVVILSLPENIKYFSGFFPVGMTLLQSVESYLVYNVKNAQMALITSVADIPTVLEGGYSGDIYPLGNFEFAIPEKDEFSKNINKILSVRFNDIAEATCAAVMEMCPNVKRIFIDESRMPISTWKDINEKLSNVSFYTETNIIEEIRKIKHPSEVELLKKAANIAENSLMAAISKITIGMSEYDIETNFRHEALKRDGQPYFCVATIDKRAAFSDTINQRFSKVQKAL